MKTKKPKKRAYIIMGNKPTLKQITERTSICVISGEGKNLRLKLGQDEGITNVYSGQADPSTGILTPLGKNAIS